MNGFPVTHNRSVWLARGRPVWLVRGRVVQTTPVPPRYLLAPITTEAPESAVAVPK